MKRNLCLIVMALFAGAMLFSSCTKQYTITAVANDATMGTVTGGGTFLPNTTVTLIATANDGYEFVQWNDGNTDNPRTITVTENANYTATFQKIVGPSVAVTFGSTQWDANAINAAYLSQYPAFQLSAAKDAAGEDFPFVDIASYKTTVGNHSDNIEEEYAGWNNGVFAFLEYSERTRLVDGSGMYYGDWWGKSATLNISAFDATSLKLSANVNATMFDAFLALVGDEEMGVDPCGISAAPTCAMTVKMSNISMESAKGSMKRAYKGQKLSAK